MAKTVRHQELTAYWGKKDHLEESSKKTFSEMVFETLSEREPTAQELKLFDLILNLSIDHGEDTPSAIPLIEAAKGGKSMAESLSQGLLQINEHHGGAIEGAMTNLYRVQKSEMTAQSLVAEYRNNDKKLPGFGHRIYKESDPRTELIFNSLRENGLGEEFIELEAALQSELASQNGKNLPINIDGAIAVVLCTFSWEPKLGNAVFITARVPGLLAHFLNKS
jgi:citrate synthase